MSPQGTLFAALAFACVFGVARGAAPEYTDALTGRLLHIKETKTVQLGYRADAIPFSYVGPGGRPIGYTLDLCAAVVNTIADDLGVQLAIEYVPVTAQDRMAKVASGAVDFECGSTTNTVERRRLVAFSPVIFVTGTRIAVPQASRIRSFFDLAGKKVAVVSGTTNDAAMREIDRLRSLRIEFVSARDYPEALGQLSSGNAVALAADDALLRGLLVEKRRTTEFRLVGDLLSFEAYGIMYPRNDAGIAEAIERTLRGLAESRDILEIYNRWFVRPLPSGGALDLPIGTQLRRSLELIGLPPE